jgi:predicted nuclease of predicted toxin-antitoxin system
LLLDENLPQGIVRDVADLFPNSAHVRELGLRAAPDDAIWERAVADGYVIITKDDDFRQRSFLRGFPPKVIWLRIGNCRRADIASLLHDRASAIERFADDPLVALLVMTRSR